MSDLTMRECLNQAIRELTTNQPDKEIERLIDTTLQDLRSQRRQWVIRALEIACGEGGER